MKKQHGCGVTIIPDDLWIDEILQRLPVKSLQRFRFVCKSWYLTISSPSFLTAYHQRRHSDAGTHTTTVGLLYSSLLYICKYQHGYKYGHNNNNNPTVLSSKSKFSSIDEFPSPVSLGCRWFGDDVIYDRYAYSKGLLCFLLPSPSHQDPNPYRDYIKLWNPILKKGFPIPTACNDIYFPSVSGSNVKESQLIFGFGYDKLSGDYKVVRSVLIKSKRKRRTTSILCANVYSLNANKWSCYDITLSNPVAKVRCPTNTGGVNVNGIIYWTFGNCVLGYDLAKNNFFDHNVPMPKEISKYHDSDAQLMAIKLLTSQDQEHNTLGLVIKKRTSRATWAMMESLSAAKETSMSWVKLLEFDKRSRLANYIDVENGQVTLAKSSCGQWIVHHLKGEIKTSLRVKGKHWFPTMVACFEESLALVGSEYQQFTVVEHNGAEQCRHYGMKRDRAELSL